MSPVLDGILSIFYDKKFGDTTNVAEALASLSIAEEVKQEEAPTDTTEESEQEPTAVTTEEEKVAEPVDEEKSEEEKLYFDDRTIEEFAARLKEGFYSKIAIMAGAGISVSAGIPDFRSPGSGLYDQLAKYDLP